MDLVNLRSPEQLKDMDIEELNELSDSIRSFLIESISKTGGHLASNLGVVELSVALHYVFDAPEDKIFFDVGHQCYTHKILTGRINEFDTLRKFQGISGFEKRRESEYDCWEAGHSSTSLSAALGMAVARDLKKEDYQVVPVIGDGAIGSGMAMEALNQIGMEQRNMVIIFNDNNMSISENVGALTLGFARLRAAKGYNQFKENIKESLTKNEFGKVVYKGMRGFKNAVKETVVDKGIFGEFNLEYMGPVDGHNMRDLVRVLNVAKKHEGPVIVHVITQKGRGYKFCEDDCLGIWHGVGSFNIDTGKKLVGTPSGYKGWSCFMSDTVLDLALKDERIVAITPAMRNGSGLNQFFATLPDRSFDCGIAEEHATTFAAGLAVSGMRPYLSIYSSFLQRSYDQVNHDICRMDLPVVIGIDRAGLVGEDGETHHGVFDIGFLKPIPNIIIAQPKDDLEGKDLLYTAFHQDHPFAIRYPRGNVLLQKDRPAKMLEIGSWEAFGTKEDAKAVIITYGSDVDKVINKVQVNHLDVLVVNARFIKPLDTTMLKELQALHIPMVVYETDMLEGGLSSSILEFYCDQKLSCNIERIGIKDTYIQHGACNQLRKDAGIDLNTLFDHVLTYMKKGND